ncbi:MAG: hypothetical protein IJW18_04540 [Lachnospiraceae bacterium]|nr:hypothetical protein [Lachnospiraceae bacterium]
MFCKSCGAANSDSAFFCVSCGTMIKAPGSQAQNNTINKEVKEEPVAAVAAEPVIEEPVAAVATEPVIEEPVAAVATEPVIEEPVAAVAAEPVIEEPVAAVAAEPVIEEPVAAVAAEPMIEETVAVVAEPVIEEPAAPVAAEPVIEEPVAAVATESVMAASEAMAQPNNSDRIDVASVFGFAPAPETVTATKEWTSEATTILLTPQEEEDNQMSAKTVLLGEYENLQSTPTITLETPVPPVAPQTIPVPPVAPQQMPVPPVAPQVIPTPPVMPAQQMAYSAPETAYVAEPAPQIEDTKKYKIKKNPIGITILEIFLAIALTGIVFAVVSVFSLAQPEFDGIYVALYPHMFQKGYEFAFDFVVLSSFWYSIALYTIFGLLVALMFFVLRRRRYAIFNYVGIPMMINGAIFLVIAFFLDKIVALMKEGSVFVKILEQMGDAQLGIFRMNGIIVLGAGVFFVFVYVVTSLIHKSSYRNKCIKQEEAEYAAYNA